MRFLKKCVSVCAHTLLCLFACVMWLGERRSETTHWKREKAASSAVYATLLCKLVGSLEVTLGLRFWQKKSWKSKWRSCQVVWLFFVVTEAGFVHSCKSNCVKIYDWIHIWFSSQLSDLRGSWHLNSCFDQNVLLKAVGCFPAQS